MSASGGLAAVACGLLAVAGGLFAISAGELAIARGACAVVCGPPAARGGVAAQLLRSERVSVKEPVAFVEPERFLVGPLSSTITLRCELVALLCGAVALVGRLAAEAPALEPLPRGRSASGGASLVSVRVATVTVIPVRGCLVLVRGLLIAVAERLVGVAQRLVGVAEGLLSVDQRLVVVGRGPLGGAPTPAGSGVLAFLR